MKKQKTQPVKVEFFSNGLSTSSFSINLKINN